MHTLLVRHYDCSNIQFIRCKISWGEGKYSYITNGQTCTELVLCVETFCLCSCLRVVQVCKSLSLLSNLYLLGEQLIRPCFFHAHPHYCPFYQFDFIISSWKNSFQPFSECLQSMHPNLKTRLVKHAVTKKKKFKNLVFCHKLGLLHTSGLHWVTAVDRSTPPVPPLSQCVWGVGLCLPKAAMHLGSFQGELQQFQAPWRLTAAWGWSRVPLLCPCSPRWAALRRSEGNITWAFVCIMQFCFKWRWGYCVCSVYYPCVSMLAEQECVLARLQTEVGCTLKKCTSLCKRASPGQPSPFLLAQMPVCVSCDLLVGRISV